MSEELQTEEVKTMSKHDFYFETPLYEAVSISELEKDAFRYDVDAYSAQNESETTYSIYTQEIDTWLKDSTTIGFYLITLTCKRKQNDVLRFTVYKDREIVLKIGQYPSLADLQFAEIGKKYNKVLPSEDLKNLKKAIGLVSHGAGAGSFVYLRRIFEKLILETYTNNASSLKINESDFKIQRMMDKVETLKAFLPSQLVEMKGVYSILGKGVHELTEEECLRYFSPIKLSIELILDQKIEEDRKREKDAVVKKQLQQIQQEIAAEREDEK
ncbi:MAG: short-chain dehydrogenase [Candidatus Colwellbacteria bacterium]|nr:short-chain dehydrogenase [Candidatus Colwellbacteria bacterium]